MGLMLCKLYGERLNMHLTLLSLSLSLNYWVGLFEWLMVSGYQKEKSWTCMNLLQYLSGHVSSNEGSCVCICSLGGLDASS